MKRLLLNTLINLVAIVLTVFWWLYTYLILSVLPRIIQTWFSVYIAYYKFGRRDPQQLPTRLVIVVWGDQVKSVLLSVFNYAKVDIVDITVIVDTDDTQLLRDVEQLPENHHFTIRFTDAASVNVMTGPILYLRRPLTHGSLRKMMDSMVRNQCDVVVSTIEHNLYNYGETFEMETKVPTGWYGYEAILSSIPLSNNPRSLVYRETSACVKSSVPYKVDSWGPFFSTSSGPLVRTQALINVWNDALMPHFWFATIYGLVTSPVEVSLLMTGFALLPHVVYILAMHPSRAPALFIYLILSPIHTLRRWSSVPVDIEKLWFPHIVRNSGPVQHGHEFVEYT